MADLTRFFPGLGLGGSAPKPETQEAASAAVPDQGSASVGAAPLMTPSQLTPPGSMVSNGIR
eukprot:578605-Rhodomonas_salina.2